MNLPIYKITTDDEFSDGEELGIEQIAFTSNPAIMVKGMAFSSDVIKHKYVNSIKMRIAAPALIPGLIYRNDKDEYYVEFTVTEIEKIYKKFMSNLSNQNKFNLEHNQKETVPAYILEVNLIDTENKVKFIKAEYNIDLPLGSMFVVSQVNDENYYNDLVANDQIGFSIEGFLGMTLSEIKKEKSKEEKMENNVLPEGAKFQIEDKWYEVKDGKVVEVVEAQKEVAASTDTPALETEEVTEQALADDTATATVTVEDEAMADEVPVVEEVPVVDVPVTGNYTKEEVDAKLDEIYSMIADLKSKVESTVASEVAEDVAEVTLSVHQRFAQAVNFINA